ncbi:MAG: SurA N-terminal domain-containing protein [Candidatus Rickettsia vulgarisii]
MLNNIRKTANSFVMKMLLAMIAFAFVGWGIKDVLQASKNFDLVKFSNAKNITEDDFLRAKAEQIRLLQKQTGTNLSEDQIKQLNINNFIINKLVNDSILNYLVHYYDLDLTNDTIAQLVKDSPNFKNEQGIFDLALFKNFLKNSYITEKKYLMDLKEQSLKSTLITIFLESFPVPKTSVENIVNHMAETRDIALIQMDLKYSSKNESIASPTEEQLKDFYKKNQNLFELPEKRSISYIKTSNASLQKQINNSNEELLNFYNENKEEFANKKFTEVQKEVDKLLQKQKAEKAKLLLVKNLEDDIAAGSTLTEISEKYELPIQNINYITYQDLLNNSDIAQNADNIFELTEGEVSYPMEQTNSESFIIAEIKAIQQNKTQEFALVKDQVKKLLYEQNLKNSNFKKFQVFANDYKPDNNLLQGTSLSNAQLTRSELRENSQLPAELLLAIFQTKVNSNTHVFQSKDKAYFAYIKSIQIDKAKSKNIEKENIDNIIQTIINSIIDELISYGIKQNNMTIKEVKL